ncbi:LysR family transcriptional regulator [Massilia sp. IC2-476]|uniref:LysR family transcriptional regulator n=1 Tax=Massilia sp. IC2-476 TaxID=2887199 RepID=UPI001D0FD6B5|nr:LysR family transcriptional regulator [Massilia sp. IC2-476]MCC2971101.1 LysR family transcriptional regulator [Massilia sp. IC2-476]
MDHLDALRFFVDVSEKGSFSAVARQRQVATSTVSLAVNQLEQVFGARLVTRSTRRLALTHEGEMLLVDAKRILTDWDTALQSIRQDDELTGPIGVTATNDFGRSQLRAILDAFQDKHPKVHISLFLSDNTVNLIDGQIDLALRYGPLEDSSLQARMLWRGKRIVCAAPSYWKRHGRPDHPNDLLQHNCMILARPGAPLSTWGFRERDRHFAVKVRGDRQASDGAVLREWATKGAGVIFKNQQDIQEELASGALEGVLGDFSAGPVDLYAVYSGHPQSRRVAALVQFLSDVLADKGKPGQ